MVDYSSGAPTTYYIHTDHVMNPQKMTDSSGAVVWDRVATPFNVEVMVTGALTQPLKFPGQFEDTETTLFQNWNRDYDASLGRYVQSDPIGLMGGINTYAYVEGNPLHRLDMMGLDLILLNDSASVARNGHSGALIGNDRSGYEYFSQDGPGLDNFSNSRGHASLEDFLDSPEGERYDRWVRLPADPYEDSAMKWAGRFLVRQPYDFFNNNCADVVNTMAQAGGFEACGCGVPAGDFLTRPNSQFNDFAGRPGAISGQR